MTEAAPAPAPAAPGAAPAPSTHNNGVQADVTAAQAHTLYGDLVASGAVTREIANATMLAEGITPPDAATSARTDAQRSIDRIMGGKDPAFSRAYVNPSDPGHAAAKEKLAALRAAAAGAPKASPQQQQDAAPASGASDADWPAAAPHEYRMPQMAELGKAPNTKVDALVRSALSTAGVPAEIGTSMLAEADRVSARYGNMSAAEQRNYSKAQMAVLQGVHGDKLNAKLQLAQRLVADLDKRHPGTKAMLDGTGAGSSAVFINSVITAAERLAARRAARR